MAVEYDKPIPITAGISEIDSFFFFAKQADGSRLVVSISNAVCGSQIMPKVLFRKTCKRLSIDIPSKTWYDFRLDIRRNSKNAGQLMLGKSHGGTAVLKPLSLH